MANTDANRTSRTKSKNKYNAKKYDQFIITVPKGRKEEIEKMIIPALGYIKMAKSSLFIQENGTKMYPSTPTHKFKEIIRKYNEIAIEEGKERLLESVTLQWKK